MADNSSVLVVVQVDGLVGSVAVLGAAEAARAAKVVAAAVADADAAADAAAAAAADADDGGEAVLELRRCVAEELEVPAWVHKVDLLDCEIGRLVVGGDVRTLWCSGGEVRGVVLAGSELLSVEIEGCRTERLAVAGCLRSLVRLEVPSNRLSAYDIDPELLPELTIVNLSNNRIGRVDVRMPRLMKELRVGGNPAICFAYPDCLFSVSYRVARDAYDYDRMPTMPIDGDAAEVLTGCTAEFLSMHWDVMEDLCALVEKAASDSELGVSDKGLCPFETPFTHPTHPTRPSYTLGGPYLFPHIVWDLVWSSPQGTSVPAPSA